LTLPVLHSRIASVLDQASARLERVHAVPRPPAPGPCWVTSSAPAWPVWRWPQVSPGWPVAREATFRCWRSCRCVGSTCATAGVS
jgi:hypothetical protein